MRTEKEMLALILAYAQAREDIHAVLLNGSRANPNAPKDIFQDYDIVYLVDAVELYWDNPSVPAYFGEMMILQKPEDMGDPPGEGDGHYTYLMQFADGNRIDLSFYPLEDMEKVLQDSLTVVLLDKDGSLPDVPMPSDRIYFPKPPTAKAFVDCCNEFWWVTPYVAKSLWRCELISSVYLKECIVRAALIKMLTWYYGVQTEFEQDAGKLGRYLHQELPAAWWTLLEESYAGAEFADIWQALFKMGELFRLAAAAVADVYGFAYPQQEDAAVSAFIRKIKDLPPDADTF